VVIAEPAAVPQTPVRPNVLLNTVLASAIGAILTIGLAFLIESLDDRVRTPRQVAALLGLATVGRIPSVPARDPEDRLVVQNDPCSPAAEAYRVLRTHLQFADADEPPRTVLVTSAGAGEEPSTAAANLAAAIAQGGLSVALVDADQRRPLLHRIFQIPNDRGLATALSHGPDELAGFIQPTSVENLDMLPAGPTPPNPSELLGSERMHRLIDRLKQTYALVVLAGPPVLGVADASILAPQVDGVILVVEAGRTRREPAQSAVETLALVGGNILGVVLTNLATRHQDLEVFRGGIDFVKTTIV
jgi:non-specific protein-tyrosine kinase